MILEGDSIKSEQVIELHHTKLQSITVRKAPATVNAVTYSGTSSVKLPPASKSAGRFVFIEADIATATNTVAITPASGDRILDGSTVVTSISLNNYGVEELLFSDGFQWYTGL